MSYFLRTPLRAIIVDGINAAKADCYSLCLTVLYLAFDYPPANWASLLEAKKNNHNALIEEVLQNSSDYILPVLANILKKALVLDPANRVDAQEILKMLEEDYFEKKIEKKHSAKEAVQRLGYPPFILTEVLGSVGISEGVPKLQYLGTDKVGSVFLVSTPISSFILLKIYPANKEEGEKYKSIFNAVQGIARKNSSLTKPLGFGVYEDYKVVEWLEEYGGESLERFKTERSVLGQLGDRSQVLTRLQLINYFKAGIGMLVSCRGQLYLTRITKKSLLITPKSCKFCNLRFSLNIASYIQTKGPAQSKVKRGSYIVNPMRPSMPPEVAASIKEGKVTEQEFDATQANLYSLAYVFVTLLCNISPFEELEILQQKYTSTSCFDPWFLNSKIPEDIRKIFVDCLDVDPAKRPTLEAVLLRLDKLKPEDLQEPKTEATNYSEPQGLSLSLKVNTHSLDTEKFFLTAESELNKGDSVKNLASEENKGASVRKAASNPLSLIKAQTGATVQTQKPIFSCTGLLSTLKFFKETKTNSVGGQGQIIKVEINESDASKYGNNRTLALKIMPDIDPSSATEQSQVIKSLEKIPYFTKIFGTDYNSDAKVFEILMEFCDYSLEEKKQELLDKKEFFVASTIMKWIKQIVEAMANVEKMMEKGVFLYHGDLNSKNILIIHDEVRIADFGISRIMRQSTILRGGREIGGYTPLYSAPSLLSEKLMAKVNEKNNVKWDVYSLGISMLELLRMYTKKQFNDFYSERCKNTSVPIAEVDLIDRKEPEIETLKVVLKKMLDPKDETRISFIGIAKELEKK